MTDSAIDMNWAQVRYFSHQEWPSLPHDSPLVPDDLKGQSVLHAVNPKLVYALSIFRGLINCRVFPSPDWAAWSRWHGSENSRHYAGNRKSDAGDVFVEGDVLYSFLLAQQMPELGGIGVYFDTSYKGQAWPMLHLDLRPERVIWCRINDEWAEEIGQILGKDVNAGYYYPGRWGLHRSVFYQALAKHARKEYVEYT